MPGGVVCYLERSGGGSMIRRVRLVAAGLSRVWTAPDAASVASPDGPAGAAVSAAEAAADWVAQTLSGVGLKRLAAVCADADGSVCAWLSAPNPEPSVIEATIAQSGADIDGSGAGVGAARLLSLSSSGTPGGIGDVSLQALATLDRTTETPALGDRIKSRLKRTSSPTSTRKSRYAVLAIPDAPIRVFMDRLDTLGIETEAVLSLWHAMASAWNPSTPYRAAPGSADARVVSTSSSTPPTAVVLVEPAGRLVWAWTLSGELVAGGSMRLANFAPRTEPAPSADATDPSTSLAPPTPLDSSVILPIDGGSRRIYSSPDQVVEPVQNVEFSGAEAGRLVMDWLAWSAQLGQSPQRVVCLACPTLISSDGGGPEALARLLARVWPNATIDGAVHEDPVGATIARLAGLGPEMETPSQTDDDSDSALPAAVRPRAALVGLSSRAGRADRALHRWIAAAMVAIAAVIGAGAYKVYKSVDNVTTQIGVMSKRRTAAMAELGAAIGQPRLGEMLSPQQNELIAAALKTQREQISKLKPPRPVLEETVRLLRALDGFKDVRLVDFDVNAVVAVATLNVPDADTGPEILDKLRALPGALPWDGATPPGMRNDGQRQYKLNALWPDNVTRTAAPATAPTTGSPTPAVSPPSTPAATPTPTTPAPTAPTPAVPTPAVPTPTVPAPASPAPATPATAAPKTSAP